MRRILLLLLLVLGVLGQCDINCDSCDSCTSALASAASGQTVCLVQDINTTDTCIDDPDLKGDITFDCLGHSITGAGSGSGVAIYYESSPLAIRDCNISGFTYGIYADDATIYISSTYVSNANTGIYTSYSTLSITSSTVSFNIYNALYVNYSSVSVSSSALSHNGSFGIYAYYSPLTIADSNISDNNYTDIYMSVSDPSQCGGPSYNILGTGNRPIIFLNSVSGVNIDGDTNSYFSEVAEIILCDVNDVNISHVNVCGAYCDGGPKTNGVLVYFANNVRFHDVNSSYNRRFYLYYSNDFSISNSVFSHNSSSGISVRYSALTLKDTVLSDNYYGVHAIDADINADLSSSSYICDNVSYDVYLQSNSTFTCLNCGTLYLDDNYVDTTSAFDCSCTSSCSTDSDGDSYPVFIDCNDQDPEVNPGADENCSDGVDNDCDGQTDLDDPDCLSLRPDFSIASVDPVRSYHLLGISYTYEVTVENNGATGSDTNVSLFVNGAEVDRDSCYVPAGGTCVVHLHWTPSHVGTDLNYVVDPDNTVAETDETDNYYDYNTHACEEIYTYDVEEDGNEEYWVDCDGDGNVDHYLDEDDNVYTETSIEDYDGDSNSEIGTDTDGDGAEDGYYDPDTGMFEVPGMLVEAKVPALSLREVVGLVVLALFIFLIARNLPRGQT